ncbi:hypothetical protein QBC40DRAFT_276978 [Triangularia verruculosa]|uniref:MARVEL domain-containing protein n=1 Tax=Triangularia verruculosa TaxID=2587418 RepID=A0AAN6XKN2_9PEZI|nr:hypothetical protein QBC40DRAFT_276978 [Triangularia verruculosa]
MSYTSRANETGLLTRWVPDRLKHSRLYRWFLRLTRVLQFLSSVISLGIFSQRMYKVYRLVNSIKTRRGVNGAIGAVEGILAAAVLYTLIATVMSLLLKGGGPRWLRWLWVLFDILFVGAFIAVAVLTSPNGGMAGPRHCYDDRGATDTANVTGETTTGDDSCDLPWGTFILAIVSTVLHAITAAFHEVRDTYRKHHKAGSDEHAIAGQHQQMRYNYGGNNVAAAAPGYQQPQMDNPNGTHRTTHV